jgi:hypothetical protein
MYTYVVVSESDRKDLIFETTEDLRKQEFLYPWKHKNAAEQRIGTKRRWKKATASARSQCIQTLLQYSPLELLWSVCLAYGIWCHLTAIQQYHPARAQCLEKTLHNTMLSIPASRLWRIWCYVEQALRSNAAVLRTSCTYLLGPLGTRSAAALLDFRYPNTTR